MGGKLTKKDVERLQRRFQRLANNTGKVQIATFQTMVELGGNPFVPHLFKLFDSSGDGSLNLEEFTRVGRGLGEPGREPPRGLTR